MKAYKSLQAYTYFSAGWVQEILVMETNAKLLFKGKVMHSQKLSEKMLKVWVAIDNNGTVCFGHCTCMAGLGEVCSHVAALLFTIQAAVQVAKSKSCTSKPCCWLDPGNVSGAEYLQLKDIKFGKPTFKHNQHSSEVIENSKPNSGGSLKPSAVKDIERNSFYNSLAKLSSKPSVLSVLAGYNEKFVPKASKLELPEPLDSLYDIDYKANDYDEICTKASSVFSEIKVSETQIKNVENITKDQALSKYWFAFRAGRITASRVRSILRTSIEHPSVSLIKNICYPEAYNFSTCATKWGCQHEETAKTKFEETFLQCHSNATITESGFHISPQYPFFGASPDGLLFCSCCGEGLLEIKCPFCKRDVSVAEAASDSSFCLTIDTVTKKPKLKTNHQYYYQVQSQLLACQLQFCYFVVWTNEDIHIERINFSQPFMSDVILNLEHFYKVVILPELLSKWFTQPRSHKRPCDVEEGYVNPVEPCYCKTVDSSKTLLKCANVNCSTVVFHKECLGLKNIPRKGWNCPGCRILKRSKKM